MPIFPSRPAHLDSPCPRPVGPFGFAQPAPPLAACPGLPCPAPPSRLARGFLVACPARPTLPAPSGPSCSVLPIGPRVATASHARRCATSTQPATASRAHVLALPSPTDYPAHVVLKSGEPAPTPQFSSNHPNALLPTSLSRLAGGRHCPEFAVADCAGPAPSFACGDLDPFPSPSLSASPLAVLGVALTRHGQSPTEPTQPPFPLLPWLQAWPSATPACVFHVPS